MNKNRIRLTESQLHRVIKESVRRIVNENSQEFDMDTLMDAAQLIVKLYGHNNMIDLSNPQGLMQDVQYVMRSERCDMLKALQYMAGCFGGG